MECCNRQVSNVCMVLTCVYSVMRCVLWRRRRWINSPVNTATFNTSSLIEDRAIVSHASRLYLEAWMCHNGDTKHSTMVEKSAHNGLILLLVITHVACKFDNVHDGWFPAGSSNCGMLWHVAAKTTQYATRRRRGTTLRCERSLRLRCPAKCL